MTLGGRIAEAIFFDKISTGAQNDLERITKLAYSMVTIYGMNDKVGHVSFHDPQGEYGYQRPYSEKTAELIDQEVRELIQKAYDITKDLLTTKRAEVEKVAKALLEKEILFKADLEVLIGPRPYDPIEEVVAITLNADEAPVSIAADDTIALPESSDNQVSTTVESPETADSTTTESQTEISSEESNEKD
jgi:cell division protease FtsH